MRPSVPVLVSALMALSALCPAQESSEMPTMDKMSNMDDIQPRKHPRLILTNERLAELKTAAKNDETLTHLVRDVIKLADDAIDKPPLEHKLIGPRLLQVSRDCLARSYALGLAWRWTGDEKYAAALRENLLTVCNFPDWNPSHFLDVAEMTHAVAVGYDWLYDWLDEPTRETLRKGLIRHGIKSALDCYAGGPHRWWTTNSNNWNQVCNGGAVIGALALQETHPQLTQKVLAGARKSLPHAMKSFAPDGAFPEGPMYWHYAMRYTAAMLAAMNTALGEDFGISDYEGLSQTALFPIHVTGPTGMFFNYADCHPGKGTGAAPWLFWLAKQYNLPAAAWAEHQRLRNRTPKPGNVIWYLPQPDSPQLRHDQMFRGDVPLAIFRSGWTTDALFAAIKAGSNRVSHAHLDLGSFVLDALGVRWVHDLGGDEYNMPGYWDSKRGGKRWDYFRLGSLSHNLFTIDEQNQDPQAEATMLHYRSEDDDRFAVVDLKEAYQPAVRAATRGLRMIDGGRAVLLQDDIIIHDDSTAREVAWSITTDAEITVDGPTATLKQDGKTLTVKAIGLEDAAFETVSAEQNPPEKRNEGFKRLVLRLKVQPGQQLSIPVVFLPHWDDGTPAAPKTLTPVAEW